MRDRMTYAEALLAAGGLPGDRTPGGARPDAVAGTARGGTVPRMAEQLMRAAPQVETEARAGMATSSVSDGGRRGVVNPAVAPAPPGVPSDAAKLAQPEQVQAEQIRAEFIQELGPEAGEQAFQLYLQHQG
jgi:hypothetical protein